MTIAIDPVAAIVDRLGPLRELGFKVFPSPQKVDNPAILNAGRAIIVQHYEDFPAANVSDIGLIQQDVNVRFRLLIKIHQCTSAQAWNVRTVIHSLLIGFKPDNLNALRLLRWVVEDYSTSSAEFNWLAEYGFSGCLVREDVVEDLPRLREIWLIERVNDYDIPGQYELIPGDMNE